jgi:hypothetical protein
MSQYDGSDSPEDRKRVKEKIGHLVKEFCAMGREFHLGDLNVFVEDRLGQTVAPDSPGRCLRSLRQENVLNYKVIDRSKSKFLVIPIRKQPVQMEIDL